jgi:hypothetical protein
MIEHYQGRGDLCDETGQRLEPVDYAFDLSIKQGAIGTLHSKNLRLPKLSVLRLQLADHIHYVDVCVVLMRFNRLRKLCEYAIYLAPNQPNDLYNLVTFSQAKQGIYTAGK